MNKWEMVKLGDVSRIVSGSTPKTSVPEYWDGDINWVTPAELTDDTVIVNETQRKLTRIGVKETGLKPFPKGTVLLSSRAPIGKVAIAGTEMYCNQGFKNIICNANLHNKYLFWYLKGKTVYLNDLGRGATFKEISKTIVEDVKIPLAPLNMQKQIAVVLDSAMELINLRKQRLAELDNLIKSVFYDMFGDPVINSKEWASVPLGELCNIYRGGSPRPIEQFLGGNVPWIKIGDATDGDDMYLRSTKDFIIEEGTKKSRFVKSGSLIFANCGVSLGFARIITFDGCIHDGWLSFEDIDKRLNKEFLLKSLNCCTAYFRATAPDGTQPNLNTGIMKSFKQILPPFEFQNRFANFIRVADKLKLETKKSIEESQLLFNSLMSQYFE